MLFQRQTNNIFKFIFLISLLFSFQTVQTLTTQKKKKNLAPLGLCQKLVKLKTKKEIVKS